MATNDVEIVNNALLMLGDKTISSLSDATDSARLANAIFATTRDALLRVHPWNFARARAVLGRPNVLVHASEFDDAIWTKSQLLPITPNTVLDVEGNLTADAVIPSGAATDSFIYQTVHMDAGAEYTFSIWLRVPSGTKTVNMIIGDRVAQVAFQACNLTTTWQQFSLTATAVYEGGGVALVGGMASWTGGEIDMWSANFGSTTAVPTFGWKHSYGLPADFIRAIAINDRQVWGWGGDFFEIEGRVLMTDEATAKLRYIAQVTDTTLFDSLFSEALIFRLASAMAYPITGSMAVAQQMWALYEAKLKQANIAGGAEGTSPNISIPDLIAVR